MNKVLQPAMGHGLDTNEQRTGRRTDADLCSLRRTKQEQVGGAVGRARASLPEPCTESDGAETERGQRKNRERSLRNQYRLYTVRTFTHRLYTVRTPCIDLTV